MRPFLLSWALLASIAGFLQSSPAGFTLGILRRDALIVPFATYDGSHWNNYWPVAGDGADVPISLRSVPGRWWGAVGPLETWQVWTPVAPPQAVKVRQPDWAPTYCQKQVGLRTDYQPRVRPPGAEAHPFPKDGLAVSPAWPVDSIDSLPAGSSEAEAVAGTIRARFADREAEAFRRAGPSAPDKSEWQAAAPMAIEALYAYGARRRMYFFEAAREYRKAGACLAVAFASGFVLRDSEKFSVQSLGLTLGSCDRSGVDYMLPLGVMSLPTGAYWIAQMSSWTHEAYNIINLSEPSREPVRSTPGGSC